MKKQLVKDITMLAWLTQLGLSVAFPLAGFVLLAVWLKNHFGWGNWVIIAGVVVGLVSAFDGLRASLKAMERISQNKKKNGSS